MQAYHPTLLISLLILLLYQLIGNFVGYTRIKFKVPAPQTSGDPRFERAFRIQQNTLEQLPLVLLSMWAFSYSVNPRWGAILGGVWLVGRVIYAVAYYKRPESRIIGFVIGFLASAGMLLGSLYGVTRLVLAS